MGLRNSMVGVVSLRTHCFANKASTQQATAKHRCTTISESKKSGYLDVVFSDAYPIASWVETGGRGVYPGNPSPTSIHNHTRPSEKNQVKLRRCLKYHAYQSRYMIYLNTHWQSTLGSAAVRETDPLAEPPVRDFTDAKRHCSKN